MNLTPEQEAKIAFYDNFVSMMKKHVKEVKPDSSLSEVKMPLVLKKKKSSGIKSDLKPIPTKCCICAEDEDLQQSWCICIDGCKE